MGSQWWEDAPLTVNVSYVAPQMPTKLPTNQLPKVSSDDIVLCREPILIVMTQQSWAIQVHTLGVLATKWRVF